MDTYESLHAGDLVLGDDGEVWGVARIVHVPQLSVALVRHGHVVIGTPALGTPVQVVQRADSDGEAFAWQQLTNGLGAVEVVEERWTE